MATIDIGKIKQVWRGTYASGTPYTPDDVVEYTDSGILSSYICIANTQGNAPSSSGTAHASWNYLAKGGAAGADGTDVGATLANKEIAFKTNAGAVDGIPIGTAGQFLKVNSGATGYEYGAVSSDYVLLSSPSDTSATTHNFSDVFTDTYKTFRVTFSQWCSGQNPRLRFLTTGTTQLSNGSYDWSGNETGLDTSGSQYENQNYGRNENRISIHSDNAGDSSTKRHYFDIHFYNMRQSSHYPHIIWNHFGYSGSDWLEGGTKGARYRATQTIGGFHLYNAGGATQYIYDMKIYGIK